MNKILIFIIIILIIIVLWYFFKRIFKTVYLGETQTLQGKLSASLSGKIDNPKKVAQCYIDTATRLFGKLKAEQYLTRFFINQEDTTTMQLTPEDAKKFSEISACFWSKIEIQGPKNGTGTITETGTETLKTNPELENIRKNLIEYFKSLNNKSPDEAADCVLNRIINNYGYNRGSSILKSFWVSEDNNPNKSENRMIYKDIVNQCNNKYNI
jgi:hypothetical protein